jgi:hypothetical protein
MKFREITSRVTGLSCPIFGVQWNPTEAECAAARRVVRLLEDRRVLYGPFDMETPRYCTESVIQIREMLTKELAVLPEGSELLATLKALRAACRKFMDEADAGPRGGRLMRPFDHFDRYDVHAQMFFTALGELRATFGIHVARLDAQHGLDVEDELAATFPTPDDGKEEW